MIDIFITLDYVLQDIAPGSTAKVRKIWRVFIKNNLNFS